MNIATIAIGISIILYLLVAIDNFIKHDYSHALIWTCYSIANMGFLWWEIEKIIKGN